MTHNTTRKQFFGKLLGVVATTSLFSKLFAKSASAGAPVVAATAANGVSVLEIRHDPRAVVRRDSI